MKRTDFKQVKELPLEFDKKSAGFHFKQVRNNNGWYVYEITSKNGGKWYEVFKEMVAKDMTYDKENSKFITSNENGHIAYPGDECFGRWAWCVVNWENVEKIISQKSKSASEEDFEDDDAEEEETIG